MCMNVYMYTYIYIHTYPCISPVSLAGVSSSGGREPLAGWPGGGRGGGGGCAGRGIHDLRLVSVDEFVKVVALVVSLSLLFRFLLL